MTKNADRSWRRQDSEGHCRDEVEHSQELPSDEASFTLAIASEINCHERRRDPDSDIAPPRGGRETPGQISLTIKTNNRHASDAPCFNNGEILRVQGKKQFPEPGRCAIRRHKSNNRTA